MRDDLICRFNNDYQLLSSIKISPLDFGFIHNDATYDVFRVIDRKPQFLNHHLDRFKKSCEYFHFNPIDNVTEIVSSLCEKNQLENVFVWLCTWRGHPPSGSPRDLDGQQHQLVYIKPYYPLGTDTSITLTINQEHRRVPDQCYNQKSKNFSWIELTFAQRFATRNGFDSGLTLNIDGFIAEGPGFGICFIKDGVVSTPKRDCLHSVTIQVVEEICLKLGIPFIRRDILPEEAYQADEAFAGSTSGGITPVSFLDKTEYTHNLTTKIKDFYDRYET